MLKLKVSMSTIHWGLFYIEPGENQINTHIIQITQKRQYILKKTIFARSSQKILKRSLQALLSYCVTKRCQLLSTSAHTHARARAHTHTHTHTHPHTHIHTFSGDDFFFNVDHLLRKEWWNLTIGFCHRIKALLMQRFNLN